MKMSKALIVKLEVMAVSIKYVHSDLRYAQECLQEVETPVDGSVWLEMKEKHPALYAIHLEHARALLQAEELRAKRTKEAFRILNPELFTKEEK